MDTAVSLIIYISAAFFPMESEPRYMVTTVKAECEQAVKEARQSGLFVTDCAQAKLSKPKKEVNL